MKNKKSILLGYRNKAIGLINYKRSYLKLAGAVGLMGLSLIVPDLGLSFIMGLMLLSPVSLKSQIKTRLEDLKFKMFKLKVKVGLI